MRNAEVYLTFLLQSPQLRGFFPRMIRSKIGPCDLSIPLQGLSVVKKSRARRSHHLRQVIDLTFDPFRPR